MFRIITFVYSSGNRVSISEPKGIARHDWRALGWEQRAFSPLSEGIKNNGL
jgi:hypothetical protein